MTSPFPYAGEAAALASSLLWAVASIAFAKVGPRVTAGALNVGKNTAGVLAFAVVFLVRAGTPWPPAVPGDTFALLVGSGLVGLTLCDTFFLRALLTIGPQRATVFMALAPVLAALGALLPPWSESPSALAWTGMLVCVAGIVLAALRRHPDPVQAAVLRRGVRYGLLGAVFQAGGVLFSRAAFLSGGADPAAATMIRLAAGVAGLLVLGVLTRRVGRWARSLAKDGAWRKVAGAALIGTFLGIWLHMASLDWAAHTGVASTLNALSPVWLIPLSAAFLGERFDARAWLSTLLAMAGIALMTLAR